MPEDRRLSIGSTSRLSADEVARHTFATARRGFEPSEVRAFLEAVAREIEAAVAREREWHDALKAAEHKATHPVLDEGTLTEALGQETARVLRSAHDAAAELLVRAEAEGTRVRAKAHEESEQLTARAEQHAAERTAQAEAGATEARRRAQEEATARVEAAKAEAEALLSQARAEGRAMVKEAQELRGRVLGDLTRRRRILHTQIEQLRAGRDRLAETISETRSTVERVTDDLFRAEDEARLAAEAAGRGADTQDELDEVLGAAATETETAGATPASTTAERAAATSPDDAEAEGNAQQAVEELFARLRAEQAPTSAVTVIGPAPEVPEVPEATTTSELPAQAAEAATTDEREPESAVPEPADGRDPVLTRRDELLEPVTAGLARRLKRAMQDDQNDILDRLRAAGRWDRSVLSDEEEHKQRYIRAAVQHLDEAAQAGAVFAGGSVEDAPPVGTVAADLAASIVVPLRRRLGDDAHGEADDELALVEHVGSAFREWKGRRVERVAADEAHAAFAQAVVAVTPKDQSLRWVVDDDGAECPDCDDNALAGLVLSGEAFPTGHVFPPAHAGCRCLLVPAPA